MSAEDYLGIHLATVDGESLTKALRQLHLTPGRKMGCGFFYFGEEMEIQWAGTSVAVEGDVHSYLSHDVMVSLKLMQQITEHLSYQGPTEISWEDGVLCVGANRIPGEEAPIERQFALAAGCGDKEMLRAVLAYQGDAAFEAGYKEEVIAVGNRLEKSLGEVHEALAWTGITPKLLTPVILNILKEQANEYRRLTETGEIDRICDD